MWFEGTIPLDNISERQKLPSAILENSHYFPKILQKLGRRLDACHQKMVAGTGARHIKQMPLGAVGVFEVGLVSYAFDARLQRQDFVVACDNRHRAKFQPFGEMHLTHNNPI